jgi:branched-subunit amino acid ABC-type transport system permease component
MTIALNVLFSCSILVLTAAGLIVIFGLMKVVNFAHGEAMMIGAYVVVLTTGLHSFMLSVFLAACVAAIVGVVIEKLVVRRLYVRSLDTILATWGVGLLIREIVRIVQTSSYHSVDPPIKGPVSVLGSQYSGYRLLVIAISISMLFLMWVIDRKTSFGKIVKAVIVNPELARTLGINVDRVYFISFGTGWFLAGFAGAILAPLVTITPNMGSNFLVGGFLTTILAGASLVGIAPAAAGLGLTNGLISSYIDTTTGLVSLLLVAMIAMRFRTSILGRR